MSTREVFRPQDPDPLSTLSFPYHSSREVNESSAPIEETLPALSIQAVLRSSYTRSKEDYEVEFPEGINISAIIGRTGLKQSSMPLPNGETIGAQCSIGLPQPSDEPLLHGIRYSPNEGHWLKLSALNHHQTRVGIHLLLSEHQSGAEAILARLSAPQMFLRETYKLAARSGEVCFQPGVSCSGLIAPRRATMLASFLLPHRWKELYREEATARYQTPPLGLGQAAEGGSSAAEAAA